MPPPQTRAGEHGHTHGPGQPHGGAGGHEHEPGHDGHGFLETARAIGLFQHGMRKRVVLCLLLFLVAGATAVGEWLARSEPTPGPGWDTTGGPRGLLAPDGDPILRYSVPAGAVVKMFGKFEAHFGPFGVRGSLPPQRPEQERRLLLVGCEDVLGLAFPDDGTEASRLAARLEASTSQTGTTWRGLGLGAPGYTARQAVHAFERAADTLAPDLVVLLLDERMIDTEGAFVDRHGLARRDFLPLPDALKRFLWQRSALYASIATRHALAVLDVPVPLTDPRPPNAFARPENQSAALEAVAAFRERCRARGIPGLVVFQSLLRSEEAAPGTPANERDARMALARMALERTAEMDRRLSELEIPHAVCTFDQDVTGVLFDALRRWELVP